jgi:hypothetical protein
MKYKGLALAATLGMVTSLFCVPVKAAGTDITDIQWNENVTADPWDDTLTFTAPQDYRDLGASTYSYYVGTSDGSLSDVPIQSYSGSIDSKGLVTVSLKGIYAYGTDLMNYKYLIKLKNSTGVITTSGEASHDYSSYTMPAPAGFDYDASYLNWSCVFGAKEYSLQIAGSDGTEKVNKTSPNSGYEVDNVDLAVNDVATVKAINGSKTSDAGTYKFTKIITPISVDSFKVTDADLTAYIGQKPDYSNAKLTVSANGMTDEYLKKIHLVQYWVEFDANKMPTAVNASSSEDEDVNTVLGYISANKFDTFAEGKQYAYGFIAYVEANTDFGIVNIDSTADTVNGKAIGMAQAGSWSYTKFGGDVDYFALQTPTAENQAMYRLYNGNSGEHFYTASAGERDHLISLGWGYEGVGWTAPVKSNTPVYRLYNGNGGEHHYTTNLAEKNNLVNLGWSYEGIGWYSDDNKTVPLYRQYNPNAFANNHNYTTRLAENNWLVSLGWRAEGIGWYGM